MTTAGVRSWFKVTPEFDTNEEYEYYEPLCSCGGGSYLGNIRSVAMYENHRSIDCIVYPKKSPMPYLSPSYFKVLKNFEAATREGTKKINYEDKVFNLLTTWDRCRDIFSNDPCSGTHVFMHYAVSESALVILDPKWDNIDEDIKNDYTSVLRYILKCLHSIKCHLEGMRSCHFLLSLIKNPWAHHYLPKLLYGRPSQEEVADFIQFERSNIYAMRLRILCELKCESKALKLSALVMNLNNFELKSSYYSEEKDFEFIRDIYYACLILSNNKKELIDHLGKFCPEKEEGMLLMHNYCAKVQCFSNLQPENRPRICYSIVVVCEMAASILIDTALRKSVSIEVFTELLLKWSTLMINLMKSGLKSNVNILRIKEFIRKFINIAPTANYLYVLCDILVEKFGSELPQTLYIEIYIKALTNNLNEKELCRQLSDKSGMYESLKMLVQGYLKMANIFKNIVSVCRECVLTAYSLMPSRDLLTRVEYLAVKSGKLLPGNSYIPNEYSAKNKKTKSTVNKRRGRPSKSSYKRPFKSVVTPELIRKLTVRKYEDSYTKICSELNNLPDPLSTSQLGTLVSVLQYPRFGPFNWNVEWSKLWNMCQHYVENLDLVLYRNTMIHSDLKYINTDYHEYNKARAIKLKEIIGKSYFSSDYSDDEEYIELGDLSDEVEFYTNKQGRIISRKRKTKKPKKPVRSRKPRKPRARKPTNSKKPTKVLRKPRKKVPQVQVSDVIPTRRSLRFQKKCEEATSSTDTSKYITQNDKKRKIEIENHSDSISAKKNKQNVTREKRTVYKNQHQDYDYSWCSRKTLKSNKNNKSILKETFDDEIVESRASLYINSLSKSNINNLPSTSNTNYEFPHSSREHLKMLSERLPQLSSIDFIRPTNTDHIVNVVQIHTTSNPLTNVSQTQTEHVSNRHSSNEIEKKTNEKQTNTHSLDNYVSIYQSNSLNNSINSIQSSGIHQGECSFTGNMSLSNQRITTDSITSVQDVDQQESSKSVETDVMVDQKQINLNHRHWNDSNLQNSGERFQSAIENAVHLSSNVIVRTSDVINPSHVTQTSGQINNTTKKSTTYCVKSRDRFIDISKPVSIPSISTNNNRSTSIPVVINTNKSNFDSKLQQNSPVQTSIGLQVNFNNLQPDGMQHLMSPNNQSSQICSNISENSISSCASVLNDQVINSMNNRINTLSTNTSFVKENHTFSNLRSNLSVINPVLSSQTQTCIGIRPSTEVSNANTSVISLMIASTQSQVIKANIHNSLYTSSQNQRSQFSDLSHTKSQTNRSDEQNRIDNLKLISQTFTATSEAIKFVTSSTESQRLIQSTEKSNISNHTIFQNTAGLSIVTEENDSKPSNRGRGNMRTYESKTKALKQANMSDMFVFEKGTLYAVQDDVSQVEPSKSIISSRNCIIPNTKILNRQVKELLEKPKLNPNASPNVTITGSMLPRFQQVFGKTKFQSSNVINDTSSLCSTNMPNNPSNPGPVVNGINLSTTRVYSSSKGVQTNHDVDPITSNIMNCISSKVLDNKLHHNESLIKGNNVMTMGNNKNNVIMTCKTVSSVKNISQVSSSPSQQIFPSNIDANIVIKKEFTGLPNSKVPTHFSTSCNNTLTSSSTSNVIYSIPLQNDSKSNNNIEKSSQNVTQTQRQLKVSPSIIQTVLRKHPNWQQNCFRQSKQSIEVQTSSEIDILIPENLSNITKTTIDSSNNKISISTNKPNVIESNVSSSMMEQVREFESVLEEVRKSSLLNEMSTTNILPQINHEIIQIPSPTENVDLLNTDSNQALFSVNKKIDINNDRECSFSFLNQTLSSVNLENDTENEDKKPISSLPSIISVRSVTPSPPVTSPNSVSINLVDGSTQCTKQIANKIKPVIKTPASSPSTSAVKVPVLQKPLPKLQEDEQTTQRIYAILDKYAEQLRNSPELKNKPAPRRRTNPPTNPSINTKRKKSSHLNLKTCSQQTSCSSSGMEMSPTSDMQAIDSEDSSNAVSHFSHIMNSPSRNLEEQTTGTIISETPLIENTLINVNDIIKKINIDAEMKSKVSQSTQIVVSGTSGSFLSIPEGSAGNVRLLLAAGKNQKMFRLHCPIAGQGPVVFQQITSKDSCSNEVKISSNMLGQNINESAILSALTTEEINNMGLRNEIILHSNILQNSSAYEHRINKPDIVFETMEKIQVLDNNRKQLTLPVMKKSQGSQSTFSVIHTLPCKSEPEAVDETTLSSETQNVISDTSRNDNHKDLKIKEEPINSPNVDQIIFEQEKLSKTLKEEPPFNPPESSENSIPFDDLEFASFHHCQEVEQNKEISLNINKNINLQNKINPNDKKFDLQKVNKNGNSSIKDNKKSNNSNNMHLVKCEDSTMVKQNDSSNISIEKSLLSLPIPSKEEAKNKSIIELSDIASTSTAEIISTVNQTSINYNQKRGLPSKTECELENENENTLSNTAYSMINNLSATNINTKLGSLILCLKNDMSAKNWNNCLSKVMPPGTEKILESENLKKLQKSFDYTKIKTFKDLKMFVFEQFKKIDNHFSTSKEYDLYDDIDGLGVDKPSANELFPEVAILNDLDKSASPTLSSSQASTSKSNDSNILQSKRKSVLSHTTSASSVVTSNVEQTTNVVCKKNKTKVSFLKQALCNELNQDSNDSETKHFINGNNKIIIDSIEQESNPESPINTTAIDSETCMSEDSTSTISSGTPHYNFRKNKNKRKIIEEDGFIESQVIKRMYRGRTIVGNEDKSELTKINNLKVHTMEQKSAVEKKESNNRRISSRLKNNNVKNNQHVSNKLQLDSSPYKIATTRTSLRRVSRKTT